MNRQNVLITAERIFGHLTRINDNLFRAELKPTNRKPAGIYYLDLNENIPFDRFEDYQDHLLAADYYQKPGDIQWNYYLLLLQDQDRITDDIRYKIEKDDKYARKYIFDEEQFRDFFTSTKTAGQVSSNIVSEIKAKLDAAGLSEIYGHKFYTVILDNFINNNIVAVPHPDESAATTADQVNFINSITLTDSYRSFPKERNFIFRKVNLVKGINGVGKTSLFEAIELSVCGKTFRNSLHREVDECVEVTFNDGEIVEKCKPSETERYRNRDFAWYSNSYPKDNFLFSSFNRFNFFNADAAQNFARSNNEEEIKKALFNIVLGAEFNHITDRTKGFYERFRAVHNHFIDEYTRQEETLKEANEIIANAGTSNNIDAITRFILEGYQKLPFRNRGLGNDDLGEIESLNNALLTGLEKLKTFAPYGIFSVKDISAAMEKLTERSKRLSAFHETLKKIDERKTNLQKEIDALNKNLDLLKTAANYFNDERLFQLKGLSKKLRDLDLEIDQLNRASHQLEGIHLDSYALSISIDDYRFDLRETKDQLNRIIAETNQKIQEVLSGQKEKERLISEIKLLGKNFLQVVPDADECPLCNTNFDNSILQQKIETLANNQDTVAQAFLDSLNNTIQQTNTELDAHLKTADDFEKMMSVYNTFNTRPAKQLSDLVACCHRLKEKAQEKQNEKQSLELLSELSLRYNVSENEFISVDEKINSQFPGLLFSFENKQFFEDRISTYEQEHKSKTATLSSIDEIQAEETAGFKTDLELSPDEKYTLSQIAQQLTAEETNLKTVLGFATEVKNTIELKDDDLFESLALQSGVLLRNFQTLRNEQQGQFTVNEAQKRKEAATKFLDENRATKERYLVAFNTLKELMSSGGDEQLNQFFRQNMAEIIDIFKTIHTPREFIDLVFENNELMIIPSQGSPRNVSQISTGQRSALALSIFIAMNRKLKQGPNIIMFDDPIAFIDDLNALSFLDYLRFFVLKENRQIFFATANARLAELFEKKFSFLEDDFEKWSLRR